MSYDDWKTATPPEYGDLGDALDEIDIPGPGRLPREERPTVRPGAHDDSSDINF